MVDEPPGNSSPTAAQDWAKLVGKQPERSSTPQPSVAGGVSFGGEDAPPAGNALDVLRQQTVADMVANRELREKYADRAYQLAFGCLWWWGLMLSAQGIVNICLGNPPWSDKVIIAVTTGVTVSVLAAFLGVIRGLFGNGALNGKDKK